MKKKLAPPHSIGAEQSVLGGLMLDSGAWDKVAGKISEDDFYREDHRLIFRSILALIEEGSAIDWITLSEWLKQRSELDNAGGSGYLGTLAKDTPSAANIEGYAKIVREDSVSRKTISAAIELQRSAYARDGVPAIDVARIGAESITEIVSQNITTAHNEVGAKQMAKEVIQIMQDRNEEREGRASRPADRT